MNISEYDKLFISGATNSGTTALHYLIGTFDNAIKMNHEGRVILDRWMEKNSEEIAPRECRWEDIDFRLYTEVLNRLSDYRQYNWDAVRSIWKEKWIQDGLPQQALLVECSPSNPARLDMLFDHFENAYGIVLVRNPYAVAEGISRRASCKLDRAARHVSKIMQMQFDHARKDNVIVVRYEDFTESPERLSERLRKQFDYLKGFDPSPNLQIKNLADHSGSLKNLNDRHIERLNRGQLLFLQRTFRTTCRSALYKFDYPKYVVEV